MSTAEEIHSIVKTYYGKTVQHTNDQVVVMEDSHFTDNGYESVDELIAKVPAAIRDTFYGCGITIPMGIEGLHVIDLGSGSGRDCYVASMMVGPTGSVVGVDMTDEQLAIARKHVSEFLQPGNCCGSMEYLKGTLEDLDKAIENRKFDLAISNCVINLVSDKPRVLKQVFDALRPGGEMFFADIYADRQIDPKWTNYKDLFGDCFAGALYVNDFEIEARKAGFSDPRIYRATKITLSPKDFKTEMSAEDFARLGAITFFSITYRCFKIPEHLKDSSMGQENYGQKAVYVGGIPGQEKVYKMDIDNTFEVNKEVEVSGNTAAILQHSWLKKFFRVTGDTKHNFGPFYPNEPRPFQKVLIEIEKNKNEESCESCEKQ